MSYKKLWINLVLGITSAVIALIMGRYIFVPFPHNQTCVVSGDIINIHGGSSVEIAIFATQTHESTTLIGDNGFTISTHQGAMPGYYEALEKVPSQGYQVTGATACLTVSEDATITNPGVEVRNRKVINDLATMMFVVGFFVGFVLHH